MQIFVCFIDFTFFLTALFFLGYQAAYSQLAFATKKSDDPVKVDNPKIYLAQSLAEFSKKFPGKVCQPALVALLVVV